jgi:hypothetical protein
MKTIGKLALTAAAAAMLSGCVIVAADVHGDGWDDDGHGYLYGAEISERGEDITILAHSNGCTEKEHFRVTVDRRGDDRYDVGFRRIEKDFCKALVLEGKRMTWSYAELGIPRRATVMITNQVGR